MAFGIRGNTAVVSRPEVTPVDECKAWNRMVATHPMARSMVPMWDELAGWKTQRLAYTRDGEMTGGLMLHTRRIPLTPVGLSRVNCLMLDMGTPMESLEALLDALEAHCRRRLLAETEMRLRIPTTEVPGGFAQTHDVRAALERWGYQPLTKIDSTYLVDITCTDGELLKSFDGRNRNKVRKALRDGATVERSHDYRLLDDFYGSYAQMCHRKSIEQESEDMVGQGLRPILERKHAMLFVERYPEGIGNMVIVDAAGVPTYQLGARSRENVRGEVRGAAQVVQYEIMKYFRERGRRRYDLGGCEGPVPVKGHPNHGVWHFKYCFRGQFVRFLPFMRKSRAKMEHPLHLLHYLRGDAV